jgi:xanthine dehydrogenase YagS FAD-binding subunit
MSSTVVLAVPWRARQTESALTGNRVDATSAEGAARAALQDATPLRENGYKVQLLEVILRRTLLAAAGAA